MAIQVLHTQEPAVAYCTGFPNNKAAATAVNADRRIDSTTVDFEVLGGIAVDHCAKPRCCSAPTPNRTNSNSILAKRKFLMADSALMATPKTKGPGIPILIWVHPGLATFFRGIAAHNRPPMAGALVPSHLPASRLSPLLRLGQISCRRREGTLSNRQENVKR